MSAEGSEGPICARCGACCKNNEVYLTAGDVRRIASHVGHEGFYALKPMGPAYAECDPEWTEQVCNAAGERRVLKNTVERSCTFLAATGCILPLEVRPLLCRIYPYEFDSTGVRGLEPLCPISQLADRDTALASLDMPLAQVREWHASLYREIAAEREEKGFQPPT